ncbi:MAG: pentapeptide repeat-containing protein [Dehalococcoidia bacterium]
MEDRRAQVQQQIEDDRVRQAVSHAYMQDMSKLLLEHNLASREADAVVREIARSTTLSTVRQLDGARKGILLRFLAGSNLIVNSAARQPSDPIILLRRADLSGADLRDADLSGTDLRDTDLRLADLSGTDLSRATLSRADLRDADLSCADLRDADLSFATVSNEQISGAKNRVGTLMPDGSEMTEEEFKEFEKHYQSESPDSPPRTPCS